MLEKEKDPKGALSDSLEMYVKVIYELEITNGAASVTEIAERLDVRAPSVTSALQKLSEMGMVRYQKYRAVKLSEKGRKVATKLIRAHDIIKHLFLALGVDKAIAEKDACAIEHMVDTQTMERIAVFVEFITGTNEGKQLMESFLKKTRRN